MLGARVLVVDDDPAIRKIVADRLRTHGYEVSVAKDGVEALEVAQAQEPQLVLMDVKMPRKDGFAALEELRQRRPAPDVIMMTAHGSVELAVRALHAGATDFIEKPFEAVHLEHAVRRVLATAGLRRRVESLEIELSARHTLVEGKSAAMQKTLTMARRAAASQTTVLLLGESGTGKEVLARHLHLSSPRAQGPFVAVNCAVLGGDLLESELFGHEKGAFTGAVRTKAGRIELSAGGTLFLDEIGELAPGVQAKLLRVLQEKEYERVGGTRTLQADVRIVAATHRDLKAAVAAGSFREDLYYRLNVIALTVPPLRERAEDLEDLMRHMLERLRTEAGRPRLELGEQARAALRAYDWPGNVRELGNAIERAVVLAPGDVIELDDLPEEIVGVAHSLQASRGAETFPPRGADAGGAGENAASRDAGEGAGAAGADGATDDGAEGVTGAGAEERLEVVDAQGERIAYHEAVLQAKRSIIASALRSTGGHQTRAAQLLGLGQPYLARLIKNLQVPR